jgi:glycosyltransferase involved in cell wall biosynthesis
MGRLGLPFVIGPLGGGDTTPSLLRGSLATKGVFREMLRDASNQLAFLNPSVHAMLSQATVIMCKTRETLAILPAAYLKKGRIHLEIGLEPKRIMRETKGNVKNADFLYAGRLIYMKGLHLALRALSELKKVRPDATLTIIGTGPDEVRLKKLSKTLGIQNSLHWMGWVSHEEIWTHYHHYTAFVFPSLHDSSGNVLLEAMSQSLPVICLDTGGPGAIMLPSCGIKVPVVNRSEANVVADLATAMQEFVDNPELRVQMGRRAVEFAETSTWRNVVSSAYADIEEALHTSTKSQTEVNGVK